MDTSEDAMQTHSSTAAVERKSSSDSASDLRWLYTERLMRLPHVYTCNSYSAAYADVLRWPESGAPASASDKDATDTPHGHFVFANLNRLSKLDRRTLGAWTRVLQRAPRSVLWLLANPAEGVEFVKKEFRAANIDLNRLSRARVCARVNRDVCHAQDHLLAERAARSAPAALVARASAAGHASLWLAHQRLSKEFFARRDQGCRVRMRCGAACRC